MARLTTAPLWLKISYRKPITQILDIWVCLSIHFKPTFFFSKSTSGRKYIIHHPSWCNSYITCLITLLNHFHIALGNHPQPLINLLKFMGLIFLKKWSISFQVYYLDILSIILFQILRILAKKITVTRH